MGGTTDVKQISIHAALLLVAFTLSAPLQAQESDGEGEAETRNCLQTKKIRRIRIVDDRNVLIYLSARRIYHNVLKYNCTGLKRVGTFSYNSNDGQMCEGDGIAAISGAWADIRPVPTCWLGTHERVSKEQADAIRKGEKFERKIESKPIPLPEPSEVGSEETGFKPEIT